MTWIPPSKAYTAFAAHCKLKEMIELLGRKRSVPAQQTIFFADEAPKKKRLVNGTYRLNQIISTETKRACRCASCGERNPTVLVYHYVDPETKDNEVSKLTSGPTGKLLSEMSKCIVLCFNCHALKHADSIK